MVDSPYCTSESAGFEVCQPTVAVPMPGVAATWLMTGGTLSTVAVAITLLPLEASKYLAVMVLPLPATSWFVAALAATNVMYPRNKPGCVVSFKVIFTWLVDE